MLRTHLVVTLSLSAAACGTGPDLPDNVQYDFGLVAFGEDTTAERIRAYDCTVTGNFQLSAPVPPSGTVRFPVRVMRSLTERSGSHIEYTSADSSIVEAVLEYGGLGEQTLTFTFGAGPYVVTPEPGARNPGAGEYSGSWTCGSDVPLAQDSTLKAFGYPDLEIPGNWRISEILTIE